MASFVSQFEGTKADIQRAVTDAAVFSRDPAFLGDPAFLAVSDLLKSAILSVINGNTLMFNDLFILRVESSFYPQYDKNGVPTGDPSTSFLFQFEQLDGYSLVSHGTTIR